MPVVLEIHQAALTHEVLVRRNVASYFEN